MKIKLLCILNFLTCYLLFSQDFNFSPLYYMDKIPEGNNQLLYYQDDQIIMCCFYTSEDSINFSSNSGMNYIRAFQEECDSGYLYYRYKLNNGLSYRDYIISGKGIIIVYQSKDELIRKRKLTDKEKIQERNWPVYKYSARTNDKNEKDGIYSNFIIDDGIKTVESSSCLTDKEWCYKASNLKDKVYMKYDIEPYGYLYDTMTPPWVEGVDGYGIGEYVDVEFDDSSDELQILNGYVDLRRMYLYKENSRVKTVSIESISPKFAIDYFFDDVVKYSVIQLPIKTKKIRITIKEVYPGEKYQDTCISSIIVKNPVLPSYEEQKIHVMKVLEESGVYKKMIDWKKGH